MALYKHQQQLLEKNPKKWLLCHDTGTGKTRTGIELAIKNLRCCLVVCPKAVKEKWHRDIRQVYGHAGIEWIVLTKEEFRRDWDKLPTYIDGIIFDEAHHVANMSSQMSKNLMKFINKLKLEYVWLLTATPYRREPFNIYTLARYLGHKWKYMDFRVKYYVPKYIYNRLIWEPRQGIKDEMAELVNQIGNTVRIDECADIPEQVFEYEEFALTKEQEKAIKHIEETETAPIVKFTKIHQIENGCLKGNEYEKDQVFASNKNERILELCESAPKVAVFCRYNIQIDTLKKFLEENMEDEKPIHIIRGETKNRDEVTLQVDKDEKCIVLITSDTCEGYQLPSVGLIVFASMSFSFVSYKQAIGRFLRIDRLKKNVYVHLVTTGDSLDAAVAEAIKEKKDFDATIYRRGMLL